MSESFEGVTFPYQKVTPADDAIVRRAIFPDSMINGCEFVFSGATLTMNAGHLMVCGRHIRHPFAQSWAMNGAASGYAKLVLTIDMNGAASADTFNQVSADVQYAATLAAFPSLVQQDINASGTKYQVRLCTVSLGSGGITKILEQLEKSEA